ncbi:AlpA family phage regulatory protein [Pseudoalteromonas sp. CNC9-20]|uniref:helix-turn-helix transcriptional regulator n=1 Tax=Pseudoalteromonas sp. CNC9-20 TaxID=2917750 RepID=UPI001EF40399|nr:AlpA family phage regulatory protein [Pseudoalteromonas sp. CNC9-20]MCG7570768.1 AlpA family phage regulatory protein [Pseudoalteromonas sp. CNC9-20]
MNNFKYFSENYRLVLRRQDLANALQVSVGTIDNMRRDGRLPEPIELSPRCIGWPKTVIENWLASEWGANR